MEEEANRETNDFETALIRRVERLRLTKKSKINERPNKLQKENKSVDSVPSNVLQQTAIVKSTDRRTEKEKLTSPK